MPTVEKAPAESLAEFRQEKQDIEAWLSTFTARVEEAIEQDNEEGKNPFAGASNAGRMREKENVHRKRLANLEHLIIVAKREVDKKAAVDRAVALVELEGDLELVRSQERAQWLHFGKVLQTLIEKYLSVADLTANYDDVYNKAESQGVADEEFRRQCRPQVQPFPGDFPAAVEMALKAAADPHGVGRFGVYGLLQTLLPDLEPVYRHPMIHGGVEKKFTDSRAGRGVQPIGYSNWLDREDN